MRFAIFLVGVAVLVSSIRGMATQTTPSNEDRGQTVFLFTFFGDEKSGLRLAWSEDLFHWTEIPGPHLKPMVGGKIMRDPFILRGPDGDLHMVWTTGWQRQDIGYASTRDLVNWTPQRAIPVMADKPGTRNCWAPKLFHDDVARQWMILWSSWVDDGTFPPPELPRTSKQHRIFYVTTRDFMTFSEPKLLFDPGYSCIDACLLKNGSAILLFFKDERSNAADDFSPGHQNIRMALGKSPYGPFGSISAPITGQGVGKWHNEGPCAIKRGGEFFVFYDHHAGAPYYGATTSRNLKDWTDVSDRMDFPKGAKHGSIIQMPKATVLNLLADHNKTKP